MCKRLGFRGFKYLLRVSWYPRRPVASHIDFAFPLFATLDQIPVVHKGLTSGGADQLLRGAAWPRVPAG